MRTKIGKRIGPVPIALVAVLALAAFVSAGLWLVPTGQTAEAQAANPVCKATYTNGDTTAGVPEPDTITCPPIPSGSLAFDLELQGSAGNVATSAVVYAQNGTIMGGSAVNAYDPDAVLNDVSPPTANVRSAIQLSFTGATTDLTDGTAARQKQRVTVQPGGDEVKLYVYYDPEAPLDTDFNHDNDGTNDDSTPLKMQLDETGTGANAAKSATITAVITPSLGRPSDAKSVVTVTDFMDSEDAKTTEVHDVRADFRDEAVRRLNGYRFVDSTGTVNTTVDAASEVQLTSDGTIVFRPAAGVVLPTGMEETLPNIVDVMVVKNDGNYIASTGNVTGVARADGTGDYTITFSSVAGINAGGDIAENEVVTIIVTYSRELKGDVTFTVGGGDGVLLKSGITKAKTLTMDAKTARKPLTDLKIVGLPKGGNLKVPVTASFTGDTGSLVGDDALEEYAVRTDRVPDMLSVKTYSCKQVTRVNEEGTPTRY